MAALVDDDVTLLIKHPADRARLTQVAAVLGKDVTNLRDRAVAIVGHRFNQQGDAAWTITFVRDLFIVDAFFFAGAATDRAIDRVVGHVAGLGVENGFAQARVSVRVTAAGARRDGHFLDELGKQFAALGIERAFLVLNPMPLRMSGHLLSNPS